MVVSEFGSGVDLLPLSGVSLPIFTLFIAYLIWGIILVKLNSRRIDLDRVGASLSIVLDPLNCDGAIVLNE